MVEETDLHTASDCVLHETESVLLDSANCIFLSVSENTGDFVKRSVDTGTKEKPTKTI